MGVTTNNPIKAKNRQQTVLIINHNPAYLKIIGNYLTGHNLNVLTARRGERGIAKAKSARPDLILLDIVMPNLDGFAVCQLLKQDEQTQNIPVIFMTAMAEPDYKIKGFQCGAVDYITQPAQEDEVLARILTHLHLRELNQRLEQEVRERTEELSQANQELAREIAARKRAKAELRQSEEIFRTIVEASPMGMHMYRLDADDRLVFTGANPAADKILGVDNQQFIGQTIEAAFPSLAGTEIPQNYKQTAKEGTTWQYNQITYQDNQISGVYEVYTFQSSPGRMAATFLDITERKRVEDTLLAQREAERRFSQELAELHQVSLELSLAISLDDLCQKAVELGRNLLGFDRLAIWFIDQEDPAYMRGTYGIDEHGHLRHEGQRRFVIGPTLLEEFLNEQVTLRYLPDGNLFNDKSEIVGRGEKVQATLWNSNKTTGMIAADNLLTQRPITERKRDLLVLFAQVVGHLSIVKQAEETLRASEERFRTIVETTNDWIWEIDENAVYTYTSPRLKRLLGYEPEAVIGKTPFDFMPPDEAERVAQRLHPFIQAREPFERLENINLHQDGRQIILESSGVPRFDKNGNFTGYQGVDRDITERKQAEAEILRLQHLLQNITNSMPSALIALNPAGETLLWNPAAESLTGQTMPQVAGQSLWQSCPQLKRYQALFEQVLQERRVARRPKELINQGQEQVYRNVDVFPLIANDIEGVVIRIDDVTHQVQLEEMMLQSAKMASIGGLAAGVAHEINNPLGAMMQSAQILQMAFDTQRARTREFLEVSGVNPGGLENYLQERGLNEYLAGIRTSGERAAKIVSDLLSFSRRTSSDVAPHQLNKLIEQTLDLAATDYNLKKKYDIRDMEIVRKFDPNLPPVICDGQQIQQVVLNLVRNAAQAMADSADKPQLTIKTSRQHYPAKTKEPTLWLRLEVEDNGPGIPQSLRERLFEPFFTTKDVGQGTGLGLWLCWSIVVERHQGRIWVESASHTNGSRFIVELPATAARLQEA